MALFVQFGTIIFMMKAKQDKMKCYNTEMTILTFTLI